MVQCEEMLPLQYKRGPRQPKKLRKRQSHEEPNKIKYVRQGISYRCTKCDKFGQNNRSCKNKIVNPEAQQRKVTFILYCLTLLISI